MAPGEAIFRGWLSLPQLPVRAKSRGGQSALSKASEEFAWADRGDRAEGALGGDRVGGQLAKRRLGSV